MNFNVRMSVLILWECTLQLLPELSDDVVSDLQLGDPVLSVVRSWFDLDYEPTIDDLRQLPPPPRVGNSGAFVIIFLLCITF